MKCIPLVVCLALLACLCSTNALATNPASEDFDYLDGDGYQPSDSNPFDDPPTGTAPAFWVGQGEFRSSATSGLVEEAPSGTNGIVSANGSIGHAEVYPSYLYGFDTFHRNGGSADGVTFTGPYSFKMDIYLDPSWTYRCISGGCGAEDDFWINQGVNDNVSGPPNGNYLSEGSLRFNVTDIAPTDGIEEYSFHTGPGGPIGSLFQTTTPGWYTLEQIVDVGPDGSDAGTDPDILFTHRIWNVQRTQILSNPNTYPSFNGANGAMLGGDRYSSFFFVHSNITPFIAIDNVSVGAPLVLTLVVDDDGMGTAADCDAADPCYSTIAAAVAAASPGDNIMVCPGTYAPFTLNKNVALLGAQAGVDACGRVASESVISGAGILLTLVTGSADAVIDGFTFSGGTRGIESSSGPINGLQILNNRFTGFTGSAVFLNDSGIDVTAHQNAIDGSSSTGGGLFHLDQDNFDGFHLTDNCIEDGTSGTGLFVDGNHNVGASVNRAPLISGNLFDNNATGANLGRFAFEFGTISGNTFNANLFDGLQGGIQNSAITGNVFSSNGRSGIALTGFGGAGDATRGAQNSTVTLNDFTSNVAEGLFFSSGQFPGTVSTNTASNNNFVGNGNGVTYGGTEKIFVQCNWWNHIDGPDKPPENPNPPGDDLAAADAAFTPWLDAPAPGGNCNQYGPNTVAPDPAGICVSTDTPCDTVPVVFFRADTSPARAASVTFELDSNLELCGTPAASILQGSWLAGYTTAFQVVDNGGGSYTVDQSILGMPCGVTTGGTLFRVRVKKTLAAPPDTTGTMEVTAVDVRDCANAQLAGIPGPPVGITIDTTGPTAVANLAVSQIKTGNDTDGTTKVDVTFTAPGDADSIKVYRAPFGTTSVNAYPEYDDVAGAGVPATPSYPPPAPWVLTGVTASGQDDETTARGFWYYVVFTKDACGNVSLVSNKAGGVLNYHLGDTHDGVTDCVGNNLVNTSDVSHLGANYGVTGLVLNDPRNCLDVGPTTDSSVNARPTTDNRIQFEDLMMFAINYGQVSKGDVKPVPEALDALSVEVEAGAGGEVIARLVLEGSGRIQGLSARLSWQDAEPVSMRPGTLVESNGAVAFAPEPGSVDAAVLGTGSGFTGRGVLATVTFRATGSEPQITLASVEARDASNAPVQLGTVSVTPGGAPKVTELLPAMPNPFNPLTTLGYRLSHAGLVEISIYAVDGRRVRVLEEGTKAAGEYRAVWDGTDESGRPVSSGQYFARLRTAETVHTRALTLLK